MVSKWQAVSTQINTQKLSDKYTNLLGRVINLSDKYTNLLRRVIKHTTEKIMPRDLILLPTTTTIVTTTAATTRLVVKL